MRLLFTVGPAPGIINHGLALSFLLAQQGHHITWLTAPTSRKHLEFIGSPFETVYSELHEIDFNRNRQGRKPHLQQLCDEQLLYDSSLFEEEVIKDRRADAVINKHYYSVRMTCDRLNLPYVMYYTDGPAYLTAQNPQASVTSLQAHNAIKRAAARLGQTSYPEAPPFCQKSPMLNIVRGTPRTAALSDQQMRELPDSVIFCGALTYDGPPEMSGSTLPVLERRERRLAYVTFGTIATSAETLNRVIDTLAELHDFEVVVSSFSISEEDVNHLPTVTIVKYLPNNVAFRHCDVVIHHGGHGTTLGALSAGVYQVIIPDNIISTAQKDHGEAMAALGVGAVLPENFAKEQLKAAIEEGLSEKAKARLTAEATRLVDASEVLQKELTNRVGALRIGASAPPFAFC